MSDNVGDAFLTLSKRNEEKTAHLQITKRRFITNLYDSSPIMQVANPKPHQTQVISQVTWAFPERHVCEKSVVQTSDLEQSKLSG